tara:strand:- start:6366 stop:6764 length:399 start_codon:yes stop_codon:yes gene_type:complete
MKRASKQIFSFVFLLLCVSIVHCIIYAQAHTELNLDSGSHSSLLSSLLIESSGTKKGIPVSSFSTERSSGFLSSTDLISNGWASVAAFDLVSYFFFDGAQFWVGFKPSALAVLMSFLCLCIRFLKSWTHSRQ